VLLLDEPSSGIAQRETEQMAPLFRRVRNALGCSILIVEHDMPLVTAVSDRLIALETGRIITEGTPHDVVNHPLVVESYLGIDQAVIGRSDQQAGGLVPAPLSMADLRGSARVSARRVPWRRRLVTAAP